MGTLESITPFEFLERVRNGEATLQELLFSTSCSYCSGSRERWAYLNDTGARIFVEIPCDCEGRTR